MPSNAPAQKSELAARIRDMEQNIYAAEQDGNDCIDYGSLDRFYEEYADSIIDPEPEGKS